MSRETMTTCLIVEAYAATHYDEAKFRPMDDRRVKRLLAIYRGTSWDCAETLNRAFGAGMCSRAHRKAHRKNAGRAALTDEGDERS